MRRAWLPTGYLAPPPLHAANNWIVGTIPSELAALKKLRRLELGTNFLQGTIGAWVGGLRLLEVLSLGANGGVNPPEEEGGEEVEGLTGPVPDTLTRLTKLVELDLQVRMVDLLRTSADRTSAHVHRSFFAVVPPIVMLLRARTGGPPRQACHLEVVLSASPKLHSQADGVCAASRILDSHDRASYHVGPSRVLGSEARCLRTHCLQPVPQGTQIHGHSHVLTRAVPQANSLTGTLSPKLCTASPGLEVLNVRDNSLEGPVDQVAACTRLVSLDLGLNFFTGSLPATPVRERAIREGRAAWQPHGVQEGGVGVVDLDAAAGRAPLQQLLCAFWGARSSCLWRKPPCPARTLSRACLAYACVAC
jgi:hypothetical protein